MNTGMCILYCDPLTEQQKEGLQVTIAGFGITEKHNFGFLLLLFPQEPPESFLGELDQAKNVLDFALYTVN